MKLVYIRWHDAHFCTSESDLSELGDEPCELHEVGFLLKETPTHVVLGTEYQEGATSARGTMTIPRVCIQEMRTRSLDAAFPKRKRKGK
jgi:hypothetical protein